MMIKDYVRLFVASRPLHIIVDLLSDLPFVSMEDMADELSADIELHVTRELDARPRLRDLDSGFKMEIRSVLCDKADGMFRWVKCSIDTLDLSFTPKHVRIALETLPKGLDETYERILLAIDAETLAGELAQRALTWLVAALRPLRLSEIMEALSINLQTRSLDTDNVPIHRGALLDACGSLVTYSEKTEIIILAHFSVKEYLVGEFTRTNLPAYHISSEQAHLVLAQSCMCYLSICLRHAQRPADASGSRTTGGSSQFMVRLHPKSHPLLDYALDDALDHFGHLGSTFKSALHDVTVLAEDIRRHSWIWDHVCIPGRWDRWESRGKPRWPAAVHDLRLYILVAFASDSFMEAFLRRITLKPKKGTNPLVYAAYFDKDKHARMLLSVGARLNQRGWETIGYRQSLPIEVAFWNRHFAMVTLFVEEGSTVPSHIFTDSFFKRTFPSSIVRLLLQTDEFAETINNCPSMTALHATKTSNHLFHNVAEQDLIAIIRRFTQVADENLAPNLIKEAFFRLAVAQGYFSAVQYLRTLGTSLPSDLLVRLHHYPGRWRTASMIQFLVENGADVLVSTSSGDSVLHAILHYGAIDPSEDDILEAVKLLVDLGCNPLEADFHGNTPLRIAIERGYISVAQYLLPLGEPLPSDLFVTLNRVQSDWYTTSMIHFLVENGVDPLVHTASGDTLLHIVLQFLYDDDKALEVVKVLVDHHCDPLEANSYGTTPVNIAVERGLISVARHLVTVGAYLPPDLPMTLRKSGWSTAPMIQFLVENHVNVLARNSNGDSMLHIVLQSLYDDDEALEVVKLLVSYGCDPLEANSRGNTPLHLAAERDLISIARYLLSFRSDITLRHELKMGPRMIRFLVENRVDVLVHSNDWENPLLHTTLQSIYSDDEALEAVKLLIGYGCDLLKTNPLGDTLLHAVVERGHDSVARYLLSLGIHPRPDLLITLNHRSWSGRTARIRMIPFLVENGVNILVHSSDGETLLHIILSATYTDNEALEAARILVYYGCDPLEVNTHGKAPLHIAIEQGYTSVARYLVSLGASLPPDLLTTLDPMWFRDATHMIPFLVDNGVNVLAHTRGGDSALHIVLQSLYDDESLEVVRVLVDHGCDPFEANARGTTPLHIAVKRGYISVAQYFVSLGATLPPDLLVTLNRDRSCWSTIPTVRFLVDNGVDVLAHADDGDSLLHVALQSKHGDDESLEVVRILVDHGCDPFEANACGITPLCIAVERGYISVAQYFVSLGAPLPPDLLVTLNRDRSRWSTTPMVRFLVENGVDVLAHADDGDSLLHVALQCSHGDDESLEVVRVLVDHGCDPFEANACGTTPLHIAVKRGYISVAQYFVSLGATLPPDLLVTLNRDRSCWSTIPTVRFLVDNGVDVLAHADDGDSLLHVALQCSHGDDESLEVVRVLVDHGCDPFEANACGTTPLHIAVKRGYISVAQYFVSLGATLPPDLLVTLNRDRSCWSTIPTVRFLVDNGVDVLAHADDGDSLLHVALQCSHGDDESLEVVRVLVDHGCDPFEANACGTTPLHIAVKRGYISVAQYFVSLGATLPPDLLVTLNRDRSCWSTIPTVRFLVDNGVDVLAHADDGDSLLHVALQSKHGDDESLEVVRILVDHGCDPFEANACGITPLCIAVERGYISVAQYFVSLGAPLPPDLLITSNYLSWFPVAVRMVHFLVKNGVNVLAYDSNGNSALHIALQSLYNDDNALEAAKVLVAYGCNPLEANARGTTPLHIAVERGHISVAQYFVSLGAPLPPDLLVILDRAWSRWSTASMIRFLVENGVDVLAHANDGDSVLHIVLQSLYDDDEALEAAKVLVAYGCNPLEANARGTTPLGIAVEQGYIPVAQYFVSLGATLPPDLLITSNRLSWFRVAARMVHFVVKNGVDVLAYDSNGNSALPIVLQSLYDDDEALEAAKVLVAYGCNPLKANARGTTPLGIAVERGHVSVASYLITQGASVLTKASNGDTVLHFATRGVYPYPYADEDADHHTLAAVEFFVGRVSDPVVPNDNGETPLHNAVDLGRLKTIKYLLSLNNPLPLDILFTAIQSDHNSGCCRYIVQTLVTSGCDTQTPNAEGDTPLQVAIKKGKVDVVKYLLSVGSVQKPSLEDLLSAAAALAPPSVQSEMRRKLSDRRARSESPELYHS
ncbi:ankyrin repeat-containing domain protein [Boletus edulis]|nr:ankyrin repeat-containing domain protein [Boletus edulis]